jgi:hypothetical protein
VQVSQAASPVRPEIEAARQMGRRAGLGCSVPKLPE